jgi:hypothetical protein
MTTDNGDTWMDMSDGLGGMSVAGLAVIGDRLYAGTWAAGVWYRPLSQLIVSAGEPRNLPAQFRLLPNSPNPFASITVLGFDIPSESQVRLTIHDLLGRRVATAAEGRYEAGTHAVTFTGSDLPAGSYLVRLTADGQQRSMRIQLLR